MTTALWAIDHEERKNEQPEQEVVNTSIQSSGPRKGQHPSIETLRQHYATALQIFSAQLKDANESNLLALIDDVIQVRLGLYHSLIINAEKLELSLESKNKICTAYFIVLVLDIQKIVHQIFTRLHNSPLNISLDDFLIHKFPGASSLNAGGDLWDYLVDILKSTDYVREENITFLNPLNITHPRHIFPVLQKYIDQCIENPQSIIFVDNPKYSLWWLLGIIFIELDPKNMSFLKMRTDKGHTYLHSAILCNYVDLIKALRQLLSADQFITLLQISDHEGWTPVHYGCMQLDFVSLLIDQLTTDELIELLKVENNELCSDCSAQHGWTPLHNALISSDDPVGVIQLLQRLLPSDQLMNLLQSCHKSASFNECFKIFSGNAQLVIIDFLKTYGAWNDEGCHQNQYSSLDDDDDNDDNPGGCAMDHSNNLHWAGQSSANSTRATTNEANLPTQGNSNQGGSSESMATWSIVL